MSKYIAIFIVLFGLSSQLIAGQYNFIDQFKKLKDDVEKEVSKCKSDDSSATCDAANKARQALSDARTKLQADFKLQADIKKALKTLNSKTNSSVIAKQTELTKNMEAAKIRECNEIKKSSDKLIKKRLTLQNSSTPADKKIIPLVDTALAQTTVDQKHLECGTQLTKSSEKADDPEPGYTTQNFYMQFGLATLAPYEITRDKTTSPNKFFITDDKTDVTVNPYIELRYRRAVAWELARKVNTITSDDFGWRWPWASSDTDFRLGFTFEDNGDQSGSAVLGSSNINARAAFGFPFYVSKGAGDQIFTTGIRVLYESIADHRAQDAHNRYSIGLGFTGGWLDTPLSLSLKKNSITANSRVYEYSFGVSYNRMEEPNAVGETKDRFEIASKNGFPDFQNGDALGLEGEFQIPFGKQGYFLIDGGIFNGDVDPNPWYIRVGVTVPLQGFFGIVTSPFVEVANQ